MRATGDDISAAFGSLDSVGVNALGPLTALGAALRDLGRSDEAEEVLRRALAIAPDHDETIAVLAALLQLQGRHEEAIAVADAAITVNPDCGEAWITRADALANLGRPEAAITAYEEAARDHLARFRARLGAGKAHRALGQTRQALAAFEEAQAHAPAAPEPVYERALLRLEQRDFAAGWTDYEARWQCERFLRSSRGFVPRALAPHLTLAPTAERLAGKRILLIGEQGIGDQLMFASLLPDLTRTAASVLCLIEPRLIGLLTVAFPEVTFRSPHGAEVDSDEVDHLVAIGSLGSAFRRQLTDFPRAAFARPRPEIVAQWDQRLGPRSQPLRVGLSWRGGAPSTGQQARSMPLADLAPILRTPSCEFVSLQYGDVSAEVAAVNRDFPEPVRLFPSEDLHDFEDLAGLMANLDLVISVQNATVHLAGALGVRCWALLPHNPEWRYMRQGTGMPWYGSVRLVRQAATGAWAPLINGVADDLSRSAAGVWPEAGAGIDQQS